MTTVDFVPPAIEPTVEHLFTPLVLVSFKKGHWRVTIDWAESFQYSYDTAVGADGDSPDATTATRVLDLLMRTGALPSSCDDKSDEPWATVSATEFASDLMEYWQ